MAVSLADTSVVVWDTAPWVAAADAAVAKVVPTDLGRLWDDLSGNAESGLRAARLQAAAGDKGGALLRGKVSAVQRPNPDRVKGLIADLEYWEDEALMGGHWTAGARVSVPFDFGNLVSGRNPFEGAAEMFTPRRREFRERLGEMVIRSHRVQTVNSGFVPAGQSVSTGTTTERLRPATPPAPPRPPRPPVPIE